METDGVYPIALLIDELKNDEVSLRLNSVRRLKSIAAALGEERTRTELIPFLTESHDDEDEVLLALAEELGQFVPFVGGPPHAHCLLVPLETLCNVEETVVRDKAVDSLNIIAAQLPATSVAEHYVPLLKRLAAAEWFTSRVSAAGLFAAASRAASTELQQELRGLFLQLCADDTPMVRRAAAQHFGGMAQAVGEPETLINLMLPAFERLASDDQDSVRLLTVEAVAPLAKLLAGSSGEAAMVAYVQRLSQDKSWRVRYNVAQQIPTLVDAFGKTAVQQELGGLFVKLLQDQEAEVRVAASGTIATLSQALTPDQTVDMVLPAAKELSTDASQFVRAAVASAIMQLAPLLGKAATLQHLLPVLLGLLRDSFPDVRLNIISKLDSVNQVIGIDLLTQSLLPAIQELAEDKHWRVRLAIIECVPLLAGQMGAAVFDDKLGEQCFKWLEDQVFSIREAATLNLMKLAKEFGPDWAKDHLVPRILGMATNTHYLYRMTVLSAINQLAPCVPQDTLCSDLLPLVVTFAKDAVPNVRFKAAIVLGNFREWVQPFMLDSTIRPALGELMDDQDMDVQFFARRSLAYCEGELAMES